MTRKGLGAIILAAFLLTGCTAPQDAYLGAVVKARKQFNDSKAEASKDVMCGMSVGGYFRKFNKTERGAIETLCDPKAD